MRFLADLVNTKVVASSSVISLFEAFVMVTYEPDIPQVRVRTSLFLYICTFITFTSWRDVFSIGRASCGNILTEGGENIEKKGNGEKESKTLAQFMESESE